MPDDTTDLQFQSLPLSGDAGDAFVALAALLRAALLVPETGPGYEEAAFALASRLVARARGAQDAPTDAELRVAAVEHTESLAPLAEAEDFDLPESVDDVDEELMHFVESVIREAALEEHTHDAYLALEGDTDNLLLVTLPVSVAAAHVWLLDGLFERLENGIPEEPLDALERGASAWYFERWRPAKPAFDDEFAAGVREQEFSLVDRPTLGGDVPFLEELVEDEEAMAILPPRQRHMARQLLDSVLGVWQVRSRDGDELVAVSTADASEFVVVDHGATEEPIAAGALIVGRLIPFGDGTWLRSPGAVVLPGDDPDVPTALGEAFQAMDAEEFPPAIVLEGALTRVLTGETPPRRVPPARSAGEAREVLASILPIFVEAGIARPMDRASLPPEVLEGAPEGPLHDYEVDDVVADWIGALTQLARKGTGGGKSRKTRRRR